MRQLKVVKKGGEIKYLIKKFKETYGTVEWSSLSYNITINNKIDSEFIIKENDCFITHNGNIYKFIGFKYSKTGLNSFNYTNIINLFKLNNTKNIYEKDLNDKTTLTNLKLIKKIECSDNLLTNYTNTDIFNKIKNK